MDKFPQQLQGIWIGPTEEEKRAIKAVDVYTTSAEAFDRLVCTGPIGPGGGILPATSEQNSIINRNAKELRSELIKRFHITSELFHNELKRRR